MPRTLKASLQEESGMRTSRFCVLALGAALITGLNAGCMSRAISEGIGVVTGASGKVVAIQKTQQLQKYHGLKVESLTVTPGLKVPAAISSLIRENLVKVGAKKKLTTEGTPCLVVNGEVTNYETADVVDTAIGPLEECIVRAKLMDADSHEVLAVANLVSRAKSTTAGGEKNLAEGVGKAFSKWLKAGGIKTEEEEKEDQKAKEQ
jgi:hypothetical protein